jgi:3-oxoacyl-[acyl-carrier protein] reductase
MTGPARAALSQEVMAESLQRLPSTRLGEPGDLASAICFLLSQDAAWVTGQVISVNGGYAFRE